MAQANKNKVLVGVIGGSGLYHIDNLKIQAELNIETPWGSTSSPVTLASLPSGDQVAFIARHGKNHSISPSSVPVRANIAALKSLGVKSIIAFSAVGSLREEIKPGDFVLPSQIIDRTKGVRPASFFEEMGVVAHASFGDPFSVKLSEYVKNILHKALDADGVDLHSDKCVVCMEGPQFSTRAESRMYRAWGGDIINMSVLPEAKLAREAEISYVLIATATDYDSWRLDSASVTAHDVMQTLTQNAETSRKVIAIILEELLQNKELLDEEHGSMKMSIMRKPTDKADLEKFRWFLPEYVE